MMGETIGEMIEEKSRCAWEDGSEIYRNYHDFEWGRPVHDDQKLFEMLVLESFQAGLSWITILKKRKDFRLAFDGFDPEKVAKYDEAKINELLENEKIIRNSGKIKSAIQNARLFQSIQEEYGSFDCFIWEYVHGEPIINHWANMEELPVNTPLSDKISKDLKKMGFKFMGSTIVYSFMQAVGMVQDHTKDCFLYGGGEEWNPMLSV